ncbi:hypothetical protein PspLS_05497 [Pyricularia sp. CBS 133598]|nr:hypothetical protein PspLS_05497 [Pyricularia sp. CBS 133598]
MVVNVDFEPRILLLYDDLLPGWHILLQDFMYIQTRKSKKNMGYESKIQSKIASGGQEIRRVYQPPTLHEAKQPSPALKTGQKLCFSVEQSTQQPRDHWLAPEVSGLASGPKVLIW